MIDDAVLEDLLREAASSIEVPADGPLRTLAARGEIAPHPLLRRRPPRLRGRGPVLAALAVAAAIVLIIGVAGSLGGSSHPPVSHASPSFAGSATPSPAGAGVASKAPVSGLSAGAGAGGASASLGGTSGAGSGGTAKLPSEVPGVQSRVVKTGSVDLTVTPAKSGDAVENAVGLLTNFAVGLGGFVASSDSSYSAGSSSSANVTVRVPVGQFESLLARVAGLGKETNVSTSGQDVTSQYVDLQARIQSLEDTRTQFEQIMTRAQSIGDILSVEQQISDLQTQIEQLQGQLQVLGNQASYSTLAVHVTEQSKAQAPPAPKPASGISKAWGHARHSFARGIEAVIGATGGIAVFLLFAGLVAAAGRFGWIYLRRRLV